MIVRDTYPKLQKTTQKTWLDWFDEDRFGSFRKGVPPTHQIRFEHPSGDGTFVNTEVIFHAVGSPEEAEAVGASFELTGFWINEVQFHEKGTVDELMSRTGRYPSPARGPGATWYGGFADMNAPPEGHWTTYMRGDVAVPHEWSDERRRVMEKPEDWKFFIQPPGLIEKVVDGRRLYFFNPEAENQENLKQTYLQQIQGKTQEWIDRRIMNRTGLYSGGKPVYPSYSEDEHATDEVLAPIASIPIVIGLDFGRDPAATAGQQVNGEWKVFDELIGDNEPAVEFAPKVKRWLSTRFPGFEFIFGGDPRGSDRSQISNVTSYDIFMQHGMKVVQATSNNDPGVRRNTVNSVLMRSRGLLISRRCLMLRTGLAGGYHYRRIRGTGAYQETPNKNEYSHVSEAFENMLIIGGEGPRGVGFNAKPPEPVKMGRRRVTLRKCS